MSEVTYLAEFRARREQGRAEAMAEHPSGAPRPDLQDFIDAVDEDIRQLARLVDWPGLADRISRDRRGVEPSWVMIDEIHHWTENNTAFEQLRRDYLNCIADRPGTVEWTNATPESRRESERVLRILRGTDHGSDDGNAEGHRDDPGVPRG